MLMCLSIQLRICICDTLTMGRVLLAFVCIILWFIGIPYVSVGINASMAKACLDQF
jgi:hypothetical protein